VLQPCDQILSANGHQLKQPGDLSKIVKSRAPGSSVELGVLRGGKPLTVHARVVEGPDSPIIGVNLGLRYKIPVDINIDTSNISGPSAGLAITLSIIDALTPGQLTGGKRVAITGTIDPEGHVGEIGGLPQKALAARNAHAQILIVPHCSDDGCRKDVVTARKRVGKDVKVAEVSTLAEALSVLRAAGGSAVPSQVVA
jgi:PDZ domain-containing protein